MNMDTLLLHLTFLWEYICKVKIITLFDEHSYEYILHSLLSQQAAFLLMSLGCLCGMDMMSFIL